MTAFVVFNPNSWGGRTGRDRRKIEGALEKVFPLMSFFVTTAPAQAAHVVREALRDGHLEILAVGGDGTINEALNGFFDRGAPVSPDAVFSFVHSGRESRLCRRFGIPPGWLAGVAHLAKAKIHKQDVGRVACLSQNGEPVTRFFLGESSFGLSAAAARALGRDRLARLFGPGFASRLHRLSARLRWRETRVRLMTGSTDEIAGIASVSLNVGLPAASGLFDVSVLDGTNRAESARTLRSARLTAAPTLDTKDLVDVETDGESAGILPATFEIYPVAINLRV
ncbi:MAG TPA: diacylglycerol kinase family protein [Rhizomicrobium sp.]|nr:diacylglycerol kinase family protein [Rhizomicrobium sp.]